MADPKVEHWRQRGTICMWQSRRPAGAWNLTASDAACDALCELLDLMRDAQWSSKKELELKKAKVTAGHEGEPHRSATQLTIKYPKDRVPDDHWALQEQETTRKLLLEVGAARLQELRDAVTDLKTGGGDYSIGGDQARLWIWWFLDS